MWHNEEILAPLFFDHYKRADLITIILDDCTDNTRDYMKGKPYEVLKIESGGLDDIQKAQLLSHVATQSKADVKIVVDSDEFIYPTRDDFTVKPGEVYSVGFWEVFRHISDSDVNRNAPPLQQRKHGTPVRGVSFGQGHFIKPIVFGKGVEVWLAPGNHSLMSDDKIIDDHFDGTHWAMADVDIAIARRGLKRVRMSQANYDNGLTSHDWNITAAQIIADCNDKLNAPETVRTERVRF